jgi:hypothetical protein
MAVLRIQTSAALSKREGSSERGDLVVTSNFQALVYYRNEQHHFGGRYEHQLVPAGQAHAPGFKEFLGDCPRL